jgi:xanthine/CO dehydrogenase XdhC/CoxF family maturation factor
MRDAMIGVQLGCAGIIQVLFEPVDDTNPDNPVELLRKSVTGRDPVGNSNCFIT